MGLGDPLRTFGGDPNNDDFTRLNIVKNPAIADYWQTLFSSAKRTDTQNESDLRKWATSYLGLGAQKDAATGQEVASIDRYFNGDIDRLLSGNRARATAARGAVADRMVDYAGAQNKLSALRSGGGDSGYLRSTLGKVVGDILTRSEMDAASAERGDIMYAEDLRNRSLGRRRALINDNAMDELVPMRLMNDEQGRQLGVLGGLEQMDLANTDYGLSKKRSALEKWSGFLDSVGNIAADQASIYGSLYGGGGPQQHPAVGASTGSGGYFQNSGMSSGAAAISPSYSPRMTDAGGATSSLAGIY